MRFCLHRLWFKENTARYCFCYWIRFRKAGRQNAYPRQRRNKNLSIRFHVEWQKRRNPRKSRKSSEFPILFCVRKCTYRSRRPKTWRRNVSREGISRRPQAIHGKGARKSTIITRHHFIDFVPYCCTQAQATFQPFALKGSSTSWRMMTGQVDQGIVRDREIYWIIVDRAELFIQL